MRIGIERPSNYVLDEPVQQDDAEEKLLEPFKQYLNGAEGRVLNQVLEGLYDAVLISEFDGNGRILFANGRATEFFQYSVEGLAGKSVVELISGAGNETLEWIRTHLARQRVFIECYCLAADGYVFPAEITISVLSYRVGGNEYGALCFFVRNVTARKKTEEELAKVSEEMVRSAHYAGMAEIATGVIHDVGNILNSINVSCDVMRDTIRLSQVDNLLKVNELLKQHVDDLPEFLSVHPKGRLLPKLYPELGQSLKSDFVSLDQELANLSRSINLIRDVITTQQERTTAEAMREDTEIEPLLEDALTLQNANIANNAVRVEREFDSDVPPVMTEKTKLIYALVNLIKNAVEAMAGQDEERRLLTLRLFRRNSEVVIGVGDCGSGVSHEDRERLFAHGFTTKENGHGFGLHASANYINEMGGVVEFDSEGRGQGAEFRIRLPVNPDEPISRKTETKPLHRRSEVGE
ncbi:MAG: two-component system sensor histidine kinase NtrB [Verrucomicrobiota bacterium]